MYDRLREELHVLIVDREAAGQLGRLERIEVRDKGARLRATVLTFDDRVWVFIVRFRFKRSTRWVPSYKEARLDVESAPTDAALMFLWAGEGWDVLQTTGKRIRSRDILQRTAVEAREPSHLLPFPSQGCIAATLPLGGPSLDLATCGDALNRLRRTLEAEGSCLIERISRWQDTVRTNPLARFARRQAVTILTITVLGPAADPVYLALRRLLAARVPAGGPPLLRFQALGDPGRAWVNEPRHCARGSAEAAAPDPAAAPPEVVARCGMQATDAASAAPETDMMRTEAQDARAAATQALRPPPQSGTEDAWVAHPPS